MTALSESHAEVDELEQLATTGGQDESLETAVARRRRERESAPEKAIMLPVPGYEDLLVVQYRALTYREVLAIEMRHEKNKDTAEMALYVVADKLIAACERIVRPTREPGTYEDTGYKWDARAASSLFGLNLPEGTRSRAAVLAIFAGDDEESLIEHGRDYELERQQVRSSVDKELAGESQAGSARS